MTRKIIFAAVLTILFASCATTKSADTAQKSVKEKIDFLLQDKVLEMSGEELEPFKSESFLQTLISRLAPEEKMTSAVRDYLEVGNYEILNAIKFDGKIFLNYLIRSNWSIAPKDKKSAETLGRDLLQASHIFAVRRKIERDSCGELHLHKLHADFVPQIRVRQKNHFVRNRQPFFFWNGDHGFLSFGFFGRKS